MDTLATSSDEILHLHLAAGEGAERTAALCEVVRRHGPDLLRFFLRKSARVRHADAEDLMQETLLAAVEDIDSYDPAVGPFRSWLMAIAEHRLLDWLKYGSRKKRAGGTQLVDDDRRVIDGPPVDVRLDARLQSEDLRRRLQQFSANLDLIDRDILETFMRGPMTPEQQRRIAECHGIPLKTMRVRQSRLLERLREPLKAYAPWNDGGAS